MYIRIYIYIYIGRATGAAAARHWRRKPAHGPAGCHQLEEGGRSGTGGVLGGDHFRGMCLSDGGTDSQGRRQGIQSHWVSGGPV